MTARARIPLIALAAGLLVAGFLAVRPDRSSSPAPAVAADTPATTATADPGPLAPFLRFSGTGTVDVKPDKAEITASSQSTAATSQEALNETTRRMEKVIARMKAEGVAADDLQTQGAQTYQEYDSKKWTATQTLVVTVRDITKAGALLAAANEAGAQQVSGPTFSIADQSAAYREAIGKALADARAKADAAAAAIGAKVTGVVSIDETGGAEPPVMYAEAKAADSAAGGTASVPVETGTQQVSSTLTVVFSYSA